MGLEFSVGTTYVYRVKSALIVAGTLLAVK